MARLVESPRLLAEIGEKAKQNAMIRATYGKRAYFSEGKDVVNFEAHCQSIMAMRLQYKAVEQ